MNSIEARLAQLLAAPVQRLAVDEVHTDDQFQPRTRRLVPIRKRGPVAERSEVHTAAMRGALEANGTTQLDPVLVALVDGEPFIVDGHHRLHAYRLAKRETIPARVVQMPRKTAVLVAKLANCTPRALEMHPEQYREAGWQYLYAITQGGNLTLAAVGESERSIAVKFRVARETVRSWIRNAACVDLTQFNPEALDPGTGAPCWRYVRTHLGGWAGMNEEIDMQTRLQHQGEKLAEFIAAKIEAADPEVQRIALRMLRLDRRLDKTNPDTLAFLRETSSDVKDGQRGAELDPAELF